MENLRRIVTGLTLGMSLGLLVQLAEANIVPWIGVLLLFVTVALGIPSLAIYVPVILLCVLLFTYVAKLVFTLKTGFGQVGAGIITGLAAGYGLAHIVVDLMNVLGGLV
jgi:hypothetical protein